MPIPPHTGQPPTVLQSVVPVFWARLIRLSNWVIEKSRRLPFNAIAASPRENGQNSPQKCARDGLASLSENLFVWRTHSHKKKLPAHKLALNTQRKPTKLTWQPVVLPKLTRGYQEDLLNFILIKIHHDGFSSSRFSAGMEVARGQCKGCFG